MSLQRRTGDLGDGRAAPLRLVAEACVEIVGELHGRALHGDASIS
jgi:hypothetical protein